MHNKNLKYIYYEDKFGAILGYIDILQYNSEDILFVVMIAERGIIDGVLTPWDTKKRNNEFAVDLRKANKWKFYDNYEEFVAEFFEAIL